MADAAVWSPLRHALTNVRAAPDAVLAGTIGSVVVVGAVVVVVVVLVVVEVAASFDEGGVAVLDEPFEHAANANTATRGAVRDSTRLGICPT
jgi:hypothetical protein